MNPVGISVISTAQAVLVTALGAYALYRRGDLPGFKSLQFSFFAAMMYPAMLLGSRPVCAR